MKDLIENSIMIPEEGMQAFWPKFRKTETFNIVDSLIEYDRWRVYCCNNSTVAYISENHQFYVVPYTKSVVKKLNENGYQKAYFYVPFSNWDVPEDSVLRNKWQQLRKAARITYEAEYRDDCLKWCKKNFIGKLPKETIDNDCMEIPIEGIAYVTLRGETGVAYPVIKGWCLDSGAEDHLGTFNSNNGKVIFVYCDGRTFVTKGYGIINQLERAGYRRDYGLNVRFSNQEMMLNISDKEKWDAIQSK